MRVGILGAGPAGLVLANILVRSGVDCVVLERQSRAYVQQRARAGLLEPRTVQMLRRHGLADGLLAKGQTQDCCEFRCDGQRLVVPYAELSGQPRYVYPQQNLVADLIERFLAAGGDLRFETGDTQLPEVDSDRPLISYHREVLECDVVAGCDGFHGTSRASIPAGAVEVAARQRPYQWLTLLADVAPSSPHGVYALHDDGFAAHLLRSPTVTRFYLQCPPEDDLADWPDERVWGALRTRLGADGWELREGPITARSMMDLRSAVVEPMRYRRLFLAGDAAHIITPMGGKGANLAMGDAEELALGLIDWARHGDSNRLDGYSDTRLDQVWQSQDFSDWMLQLVHSPPRGTAGEAFVNRLRRARLARLRTSATFLTAFAEDYVGV